MKTTGTARVVGKGGKNHIDITKEEWLVQAQDMGIVPPPSQTQEPVPPEIPAPNPPPEEAGEAEALQYREQIVLCGSLNVASRIARQITSRDPSLSIFGPVSFKDTGFGGERGGEEARIALSMQQVSMQSSKIVVLDLTEVLVSPSDGKEMHPDKIQLLAFFIAKLSEMRPVLEHNHLTILMVGGEGLTAARTPAAQALAQAMDNIVLQ